jgi:hypothetical protein
MPSPRREKLIRVLTLAVLILAVVRCGGKAASQEQSSAAGGAGGSASSAGAAGVDSLEPTLPEPNVVFVNGEDGGVDRNAMSNCLRGLQGFSAQAADMAIRFEGVVGKPGDYEGDSVHVLWLDVRRPSGEAYRASVGLPESGGSISLHVEQVEPRFRGSLEAVLPAEDDPTLMPLKLSLTFDIDPLAGCP